MSKAIRGGRAGKQIKMLGLAPPSFQTDPDRLGHHTNADF